MSIADGEQVLRGLVSQLRLDRAALLRIADTLEQRPCPTVADAVPLVLSTLRQPTKDAYARGLSRLTARAGDRPLDDITLLELRQWAADIERAAMEDPRGRHGRGASERFVNACRYLFRSAVEAGWIAADPSLRLKSPRRPQSARRALRSDELQDLFDVALCTGRDPDLDILLLWFARETAARREGLLGLHVRQIDASTPSVRLTEKNRHTREIPISTALCSALQSHRAARAPECDRVFHFRNGRCLSSRRLDGLFSRVQEQLPWAATLGVSLHWLRHTTLTDIERVAGDRIAQAYAGHADDARGVTGIYTKVEFSELQRAHSLVFNHDSQTPHR